MHTYLLISSCKDWFQNHNHYVSADT